MNDYSELCKNLVPRKVENTYERPAWWRVRIPELIEDIGKVKKGQVEVLTHTPGGFPVYCVSYGRKLPQRKTTRKVASKGWLPGRSHVPSTVTTKSL